MELRAVIVGNQHRPLEAQERYHQLEKDEALDLVREPDNEYDENAIAVYSDGIKIGYIPRTMNADLAEAMDEGRVFQSTYDPDIDRLFVTEVEDNFEPPTVDNEVV